MKSLQKSTLVLTFLDSKVYRAKEHLVKVVVDFMSNVKINKKLNPFIKSMLMTVSVLNRTCYLLFKYRLNVSDCDFYVRYFISSIGVIKQIETLINTMFYSKLQMR